MSDKLTRKEAFEQFHKIIGQAQNVKKDIHEGTRNSLTVLFGVAAFAGLLFSLPQIVAQGSIDIDVVKIAAATFIPSALIVYIPRAC
jgi:hypothetical protein